MICKPTRWLWPAPKTRSALRLLWALLAVIGLTQRAWGADHKFGSAVMSKRLQELARTKRWHEDAQWLRLYYYNSSLLSQWVSQAGNPRFFISPQGRRHPDLELQAFIAGSLGPQAGEPDEQAACRFPARYLWLQQMAAKEGLKLDPVKCPIYERYRKRLSTRSVYVVFSSFFLDSPASAFGHTFLRLSKREGSSSGMQDRAEELLDFGIGLGADVTTNNIILYPIFGLAGMFQGSYTNVPYYYKVREYNDFESRDLWSYRLNLTPAEIDMLVAHFWELDRPGFPYYFLTLNCSYFLVATLEAAAPRLQLIKKLPFWIIPTDTLKALAATPGLLEEPSYRPSLRGVLAARYAQLDGAEKKAFGQVMARGLAALNQLALSQEQKARVLDAVIDNFDVAYPKEVADPSTSQAQDKQKILIERAGLEIVSEPVQIETPKSDAPHLSHPSARASLLGGYKDRPSSSEQGAFVYFQQRFALHDLLDGPSGYPETGTVEFFRFDGRYTLSSSRWSLTNVTPIHIESLNPVSHLNRSLSWEVAFGAKATEESDCDACTAGYLVAGAGYTWRLRSGLFTWMKLGTDIRRASDFVGRGWRLYLGPEWGSKWQLRRDLALVGRLIYRKDLLDQKFDHFLPSLQSRWSLSSAWAAELNFSAAQGAGVQTALESRAGVNFYY